MPAARSRAASGRLSQAAEHGSRDRGRIIGVDQQRRVAAHLGQRGAVGGDHRRAARHRLQARQPEALVARRQHERLSAAVQADEQLVGDVAERPQAGQRPCPRELRPGVPGPYELDPALPQGRRAGERARRGSCAGRRWRSSARRGGAAPAPSSARRRRRSVRAGEKRESTPPPITVSRSGSSPPSSTSSRRENSDTVTTARARRAAVSPIPRCHARYDARVGGRLAQHGRVVDDDHVARPRDRREVGGREDRLRAAAGGEGRQRELLPRVPGGAGVRPRGRPGDQVTLRIERAAAAAIPRASSARRR